MNKTAIKNFAVWAREKLISDITYKAGMLGVTAKGAAEALPQSTADLKFFDIGTKAYAEVHGKEIAQREALLKAINTNVNDTNSYAEAFQLVVERVAYTWFNRLIAIRFMEVNDYLPDRIRVLSSENRSKLEPDFVTSPFDTDLEFTTAEQEHIMQLKDANKLDELFRMLFIKECNSLNAILSELFEKIDDYTELLLTISFSDRDGVVYRLTHDIAEEDFDVSKEGQVEIIGWLYQYYNTEPKAAVQAKTSGSKITKEEVPAATQIFTPDWIVRYMVENSLGRIWVEGHPNKDLQASWKYYLPEAEQEDVIKVQLESIRAAYKELTPEKIRVVDPCMGSGHILVYAFTVLMQIYESCGYTQRDAARSILQNNLYGLDIDERAYQLAYFAVMMKAREYNRRILREGIVPNLCVLKNSKAISEEVLERLGDCKDIAVRMLAESADIEEYGSAVKLSFSVDELVALEHKIAELEKCKDSGNLVDGMEIGELLDAIEPVLKQSKILVQKYEVVATNPPYIPVSKLSEKANNYFKKNYPDSKTDLFAVFIERCQEMLAQNGLQAMITMHSWMFLSSYKKLRFKLVTIDFETILHLGAHTFEELGGEVVQTVAFILRKIHFSDYISICDRLVNFDNTHKKEAAFLSGNYRYHSKKSSFEKIPAKPYAYWINEHVLNTFLNNNGCLGDLAEIVSGMTTGNNDIYLKGWTEISASKIAFGYLNVNDINLSITNWIPYHKGGAQRKWYGNHEYVVDWSKSGEFNRAKTTMTHVYLKPCITWSDISGNSFAGRYCCGGFMFDVKGSCAFASEDRLKILIGIFNSKIMPIYVEALNPTTTTQVGDIKRIPLMFPSKAIEEHINKHVDKCVYLSKRDWDSFEFSWDFAQHPLVRLSKSSHGSLETAFCLWDKECTDRFTHLKANEEELNRIFIDIYGLQEELTPEVADKDVTVRRADVVRDIKSLISYAVGCMFGRYSLDKAGLAYAGGTWDATMYQSYLPDADNCIPITDEAYFSDDIVGLFVDFVKLVYGEANLEANLDYIAAALGNKCTTSREVIRKYFLTDFIKDHIKLYQSRPIYWLFDSGKQNGFKALVYMHRWYADTIGNMRVEYLHRMQNVYAKESDRMQEIIDNSSASSHEITVATKRKEKLTKQLKETTDYDAKISHLALARIALDLDDGVKINYRKAQTATDGEFLEVLAEAKKIMCKPEAYQEYLERLNHKA